MGETNLDYPGKPNAVRTSPDSGEPERWSISASCEVGGRWLQAKECKWPLEARNGFSPGPLRKEM